MIKYMLSIIMDGIKDTNMLIDYANMAYDEESPYATWFKNKAKARLDQLGTDYDFVSREIGLADKVRNGDVIADALMCHLNYQMKEITERYNAI